MDPEGIFFSQKHPRVKVLSVAFKGFRDLLEATFVKKANIIFERFKLLSQKKRTEGPMSSSGEQNLGWLKLVKLR